MLWRMKGGSNDTLSGICKHSLFDICYSYNLICNLVNLNNYESYEEFKNNLVFEGNICSYEYYLVLKRFLKKWKIWRQILTTAVRFVEIFLRRGIPLFCRSMAGLFTDSSSSTIISAIFPSNSSFQWSLLLLEFRLLELMSLGCSEVCLLPRTQRKVDTKGCWEYQVARFPVSSPLMNCRGTDTSLVLSSWSSIWIWAF